jgi:radical SAM superfamily enzyme
MPWVMIATAGFELDEEMIDVMRDSGCEYIDVAVESGTNRIRKFIGKPGDLLHVAKMVKYAQAKGIFVTANVIVGFPTETWAEIRETLRVVEYIINADYTKVFTAIPLKNTKLWQYCEENHCFRYGFNPNSVRWAVGQIETDEFLADELTILRAFEWDRINFSDEKKANRIADMMMVSAEEMNNIRRLTRLNALLSIKGTDVIQDEIRASSYGVA